MVQGMTVCGWLKWGRGETRVGWVINIDFKVYKVVIRRQLKLVLTSSRAVKEYLRPPGLI